MYSFPSLGDLLADVDNLDRQISSDKTMLTDATAAWVRPQSVDLGWCFQLRNDLFHLESSKRENCVLLFAESGIFFDLLVGDLGSSVSYCAFRERDKRFKDFKERVCDDCADYDEQNGHF